jgi:flagellar biosynthetic protein FliQ
MAPDDVARLAREALLLVLALSAPALAVSLLVGLLVSLGQAVTQLQDATLSFVPRMAAVFFVLLVAGSWMGTELARFTSVLWQNMPAVGH